MRSIFLKTALSSDSRRLALPWLQAPLLRRAALGVIVAVAAALRFLNLGALGYVNHYYSAGIVSMLESWHNFFFVAAEPGGAVSIDKPPLGLWLQALSAAVFGVNGFGVLLPEILAGIGAVVLLYHLVGRRFGAAAGLLSALVLAITPVVIATDRNNTMDSTLIFTLLLATWAFIIATERAQLRFVLLGAVLVGLGFNIKMLQAFLPLPAFYALYLLGARAGLWRKLGHLALATVLLLVVSLAWAVAVDLTPAEQRPYVGSSGDNSVLSLITGYNGTMRLLGMGGRGGLFGGRQGGPAPGGTFDGRQGGPFQGGPGGNNGRPRQDGGTMPGGVPPGGMPRSNGNAPGGTSGAAAAGFSQTGRAGLLRLFTPPLSKEVSWLLPFGLVGMALLIGDTKLRWPLAHEHQAVLLWGGWLLTGGAFFSIAGFFHEYYLSMIAAPLAALVGIGTVQLWRLRASRPWRAFGLLLVAAGLTLALQLQTARAFVGMAWWLLPGIGLFVAGAALALVAALRAWPRAALAAWGMVVAALLLVPGVWAVLTTLNPSSNQSLPSAYSGAPSGPANNGAIQVDSALLAYLQAHTQGERYLMAVPSSMQGSDYVLATGRPVLYLGGFMGQDEVMSSAALEQLVADGELRYIYWNADGRSGPGNGGQRTLSEWIAGSCRVVEGFTTETRNMGAPGGTEAATPGGAVASGRNGFGNFQIQLYDCAAR